MANIGAIPTAMPIKIASAVVATGAQNAFTFSGSPADGDFSVVFQFIGSGTGLTVNLEASLDGGTTFTTFAVLLTTLAAPQIKVITPLVSGAIYRLNFTAVAGGSTDTWISTN